MMDHGYFTSNPRRPGRLTLAKTCAGNSRAGGISWPTNGVWPQTRLLPTGRDVRFFLKFLTGHAGAAPSLVMLNDLRSADFRAFLAERRRSGAGGRSLARNLAGVRSLFVYLDRRGLVDNTAIQSLRAPRLHAPCPSRLPSSQRPGWPTAPSQRLGNPGSRPGCRGDLSALRCRSTHIRGTGSAPA